MPLNKDDPTATDGKGTLVATIPVKQETDPGILVDTVTADKKDMPLSAGGTYGDRTFLKADPAKNTQLPGGGTYGDRTFLSQAPKPGFLSNLWPKKDIPKKKAEAVMAIANAEFLTKQNKKGQMITPYEAYKYQDVINEGLKLDPVAAGLHSTMVQRIEQVWNEERQNVHEGDIGNQFILTGDPKYLKEIDDFHPLTDQEKFIPESNFEKMVSTAAKVAPFMTEVTKEAGKEALFDAIAAGTGTFYAANPEAAPAAMAEGLRVGALSGSLNRTFQIESGQLFVKMYHYKGTDGKKINLNVARAVSGAYGAAASVLDSTGFSLLIKTIPGLGEAFTGGTLATITGDTLKEKLLDIALHYTGDITKQTGVMISREASQIVLGEIGKYISNKLSGSKILQSTWKDAYNKIAQTYIGSIKDFAILSAPGALLRVGGVINENLGNSEGETLSKNIEATPENEKSTPEQTAADSHFDKLINLKDEQTDSELDKIINKKKINEDLAGDKTLTPKIRALKSDIIQVVGKEKADVATSILTARAKAVGMTPDEYIEYHNLSVEPGKPEDIGVKTQQEGQGAPKAAVIFDDTKTIIKAFKAADISSVVHELGHVFRRDLGGDDLKTAAEWAGAHSGLWTEAAEEKFARGFEKYLATGEAPAPEMDGIFKKLKVWMTNIYHNIKGSSIDVNIPPEMKAVYDKLLFSDDEIQTNDLFKKEGPATEFKDSFDKTNEYYKDSGAQYKAPNGEPTNLNKNLWTITRTPEFEDWFSGSAILDKQKDPLVVYPKAGAYSDTPPASNPFGAKPEPTFLSIKDPAIITSEKAQGKPLKELISTAKGQGHDGLIVQDKAGTSYFPFKADQAKKASGSEDKYSNTPKVLMQTEEIKKEKDRNTPEYKAWSRGYPELSGKKIVDAEPDKGYVFEAYHGTTHDFSVFDPTIKGNVEGQFGAVNYFTSSKEDAQHNYTTAGADLANRVDESASRNIDMLGDMDTEDIKTLADKYGLTFDPDKESYPDELPQIMAEDELKGHNEHVKKVLVRLDNPAYINGEKETWIENLSLNEALNTAAADVLIEKGVDFTDKKLDVGKLTSKYEDEIQARVNELLADKEPEILQAINEAAYKTDADIDPQQVYEELELYDPEITATELERSLRESDSVMEATDNDTGEIIGAHFIGQVFKNLGYDGIVLENADKRFNRMDMEPDTAHIHVFEDTPEQIKSVYNKGAWSKNPDIFLQRDKPKKDFISYHNTEEKGLLDAINMGGLAVPSIAITKKNIPFENFGDITLIGNKDMIDPAKADNQVYASDVYSARIPQKEYDRIESKSYKLFKKLKPSFDETGSYLSDWDYKSKKDLEEEVNRVPGWKVAYLRDKKIPLRIPTKKIGAKLEFLNTPDFVKFIKTHDDVPLYPTEISKEYLDLSKAVKKSIKDYAKGDSRIERIFTEHYFDKDGILDLYRVNEIVRDAKNLTSTDKVVDAAILENRLNKKFTKKLTKGFHSWAHNKIDEIYSDPYIKKGRKKLPYNLDNIISVMKNGKTKAAEETMTYSPAKARAEGAKQFKSIKAIHDADNKIMTANKVTDYIEKTQDPMKDKYQKEILKHSKYPSSWDDLDDSMKVIGEYLTGKPTAQRMKSIMQKYDFVDVPDRVVNSAMNYADLLKDTPTQYFEGKLQRVVPVSEFSGAVIPKSTGPELRKALKEQGVSYRVYDPMKEGDRQEKINTFQKKRNVLFQRENKEPWPEDFPNAVIHTTLKKLRSHEDYIQAKSGSVEKAISLVGDIINPKKIEALYKKYPDAIVVAPHAEEATGKNAIPQVYAEALGDAGFKVDNDIIQINRPQRTNKNSVERLINRPVFDGKVEPGKKYILVDDALGQGGTLSELRHYIINKGGKVVSLSSLTAGIYGAKVAIKPETIEALETKFNKEKLKDFLNEYNIAGNPGALTEKEGRFILKQKSLDSLRNRLAQEGQIPDLEGSKGKVQTPVLFQKEDKKGLTPEEENYVKLIETHYTEDQLKGYSPELLAEYRDNLKKAAIKAQERLNKEYEKEDKISLRDIKKEAKDIVESSGVFREWKEAIDQGSLNLDNAYESSDKNTVKELMRRRPGLFKKGSGQYADVVANNLGYDKADDLFQAWLDAGSKKEAIEKVAKDLFSEYEYNSEKGRELSEGKQITDLTSDELNNVYLKKKPVNKQLKGIIRKNTGQVHNDEKTITDREALRTLLRREVATGRKAFSEGNKEGVEKAKAHFKEILEKASIRKKTSADINQLKRQIKTELKWAGVKTQNGKPAGKFTPEIQDTLDKMIAASKLTTQEAQAKIADNLEKYPGVMPQEVALENHMLEMSAHLDKMKEPKELQDLLQEVRDLKNEGRLSNLLKNFNRSSANQARIDNTVDELGGLPEDLKYKGLKDYKATSFKKGLQLLKSLGAHYMGWDDLLDILSSKSKTKAGESFISKDNDVLKTKNLEKKGLRVNMEKMNGMYKDAFGLETNNQVLKKLKDDHTKEIDFNNISITDPETDIDNHINLKFTKAELRKRCMELLDPTLDETFRNMGYNTSTKATLFEALTPQDRKLMDAEFKFYRDYYDGVNEVYKKMYGVNLPKNDFYSPISREGVAKPETDSFGEFTQETAFRASAATAGSLKSRVDNTLIISRQSDMHVLERHISDMEHFKSWAEKIRDMNAIWKNPNVRASVLVNHGEGYLSLMDKFISDMANDGNKNGFKLAALDKFRTNLTKAVIAMGLDKTLKQLTSFAAYAEKMPVGTFAKNLALFWAHPLENAKELREASELLKNRGGNIDRDIKDAMRSQEFAAVSKVNTLSNMLMLNVKAGDQGAIVYGGWAYYKYLRDSGLSKEDAIYKFEKFTEQTQQSGDMSEQSSLQRSGSLGKLFSMFRSSQNQYLRKEIGALRNLFAGRTSKTQAFKTLMIYHVMLPMLFQFAADRFTWNADEQKRAALFGSLNGWFIFGDGFDYLTRSALGMKTFNSELPVVSIFQDMVDAWPLTHGLNLSTEEFLTALRRLSKVGGEAIGLPLKTGFDMTAGANEALNGEYEKGITKMMGYSPYIAKEAANK